MRLQGTFARARTRVTEGNERVFGRCIGGLQLKRDEALPAYEDGDQQWTLKTRIVRLVLLLRHLLGGNNPRTGAEEGKTVLGARSDRGSRVLGAYSDCGSDHGSLLQDLDLRRVLRGARMGYDETSF